VTSVSADALRPLDQRRQDASAPSFTLLVQDGVGSALRSSRRNEVCSLATDLESDAAPLQTIMVGALQDR